jgi:hypothetical protein
MTGRAVAVWVVMLLLALAAAGWTVFVLWMADIPAVGPSP